MPTVTVDDVQEALTNVIDPELGLDFVELGLIYEVEVEGGDVFVSFTLTSPGCPIGPQVAEQIEEFVSELDGVGSVHSQDDLHARLDARHDERGSQVRTGLLTPSDLPITLRRGKIPTGDGWWAQGPIQCEEERELAGRLAGVLFLTAGVRRSGCCSCRASSTATAAGSIALAGGVRGVGALLPGARAPGGHGAWFWHAPAILSIPLISGLHRRHRRRRLPGALHSSSCSSTRATSTAAHPRCLYVSGCIGSR